MQRDPVYILPHDYYDGLKLFILQMIIRMIIISYTNASD